MATTQTRSLLARNSSLALCSFVDRVHGERRSILFDDLVVTFLKP